LDENINAQVEAQDGDSEGYHSDNPELCLEDRDLEGWEDVEWEDSDGEDEARDENEEEENMWWDVTTALSSLSVLRRLQLVSRTSALARCICKNRVATSDGLMAVRASLEPLV
jgi:hypothetical protein